MEKQPEQAVTQLPAWETPEGWEPKSVLPPQASTNQTSQNAVGPSLAWHYRSMSGPLAAQLDRYMPPNRTYTRANLKRRTVLIASTATFLAFLALILGLSIGLTRKGSDGASDLPLPTGTDIYHGDLTYYEPGLGACGLTSSDNDNIVAISHTLFDSQSKGSDPNANPLCGRMLRAQRFDSRVGKMVSLDLKVVDRCVGCQPTDLDVSPGAFNQLADSDLGRVHDMSWAWI